VEVTVVGVLVEVAGRPCLRMVEGDRTLPLARLEHKVQWDPKQKREQPATAEERESYQRLVDHLARENKPLTKVRITGPLKPPDRRGGSPILSVRTFAQLEP
jgi:hypothetical protein